MYALELIAEGIIPVKTSDTIRRVMERMNEFRLSHLPIVNDHQFLGLISEDDLIEEPDQSLPVGSLSLSLHNSFVFEYQHAYDVIRLFYEQKLTVVPVIDSNKNYKGLITIDAMIECVATLSSVKEPGSIIVLEISNRNNSLSHIAQIVESDNAQILSSYIQSFPDSTRLLLTLKLNRTDVSSILASFLRYDYHVQATFNDNKADDGTADRYMQLMNYLDL